MVSGELLAEGLWTEAGLAGSCLTLGIWTGTPAPGSSSLAFQTSPLFQCSPGRRGLPWPLQGNEEGFQHTGLGRRGKSLLVSVDS